MGEERVGKEKVLKGWETGEIIQKSLIFWNRKRLKGRRPWKKGKELEMQCTGSGRRREVWSTPNPSPPPFSQLGTSLTLLGHRLTKTSNIQHTNVSGRTFKWEALIDLRHNMIEQFGVKRFAQCISCSTGLFWLQWHPVKGQQKTNYLSPSSHHIRTRSLKYLTLLLLRD